MQQSQRRRNREKAGKDETQDQQISALQADLGELELTVGALTSLLLSKATFTTEELKAVIDTLEDPTE